MPRHRADLDGVGVVAPRGGERAQHGELAALHLDGIVLLHMVIPKKVEQTVHEHEPALLGGGGAEVGRLRGDDARCEHDVAELDDRVIIRVCVPYGIVVRIRPAIEVAAEGEHVRGRVDAAPGAVERAHLRVVDVGHRHLGRARDALLVEHGRERLLELLLGEQERQPRIVRQQDAHQRSFRPRVPPSLEARSS